MFLTSNDCPMFLILSHNANFLPFLSYVIA